MEFHTDKEGTAYARLRFGRQKACNVKLYKGYWYYHFDDPYQTKIAFVEDVFSDFAYIVANDLEAVKKTIAEKSTQKRKAAAASEKKKKTVAKKSQIRNGSWQCSKPPHDLDIGQRRQVGLVVMEEIKHTTARETWTTTMVNDSRTHYKTCISLIQTFIAQSRSPMYCDIRDVLIALPTSIIQLFRERIHEVM